MVATNAEIIEREGEKLLFLLITCLSASELKKKIMPTMQLLFIISNFFKIQFITY